MERVDSSLCDTFIMCLKNFPDFNPPQMRYWHIHGEMRKKGLLGQFVASLMYLNSKNHLLVIPHDRR